MRFIASYTDDMGATDEIAFTHKLTYQIDADTKGVSQALAQRLTDTVSDATDEKVKFEVSSCEYLGRNTWAFIVHTRAWSGVGFIKKA